jgi:phosphate transport system protein
MPDRPVHLYIKELSLVLVDISNKVVGNLFDALRAVKYHDANDVPNLKLAGKEIDSEELDLEERCIAFLALHHPVAKDLRTIVTILMINDDLERIGELSDHIIDLMLEISPELLESLEFEKMSMHTGEMVKKSIDAFVLQDRVLAEEVCAHDEKIDAMHRFVFNKATTLMKSQDANVEQLADALSISRYIERMADHASKIAQEVIYLVSGEIMHHKDDYEDLVM